MRKAAEANILSRPEQEIGIAFLPFACAMLDATGEVLDSNHLMRQIVGAQRGRTNVTQMVTGEFADKLRLALARTMAKDGGVDLELAFSALPTRVFKAALSRPYRANGSTRVLLQLVDISPLRDQIEDLALRESRWNNALISSVSGVWDQKSTGELYYSDIWRQIRGLGPDDPIPPTIEEWLEFVHPQDRERVLHCIERQNAGDPDYMTFQYRERHRAGGYVWIECRGACIERDEVGRPARITGTDTDITQRKEQEEKLESLTRRLSLALEISRIGVFETDITTGLGEWDEGMHRIFELEPAGQVPLGKVWLKKLHPDDRDRVLNLMYFSVARREAYTDEFRIIAKDGSVRHIRASCLPFVDQDGQLKVIGVNWDVTEDYRLRFELERQKTLAEARNVELEQMRSEAEHSAMHDYLTGLPNRRFLEAKLDEWRSHAANRRKGIAVLHIDLDRFKQINDTLGHGSGDAMLQHAAHILCRTVRRSDLAARIGGDEFVLLLEFDGDVDELGRIAQRIISDMRQPVEHNGYECRIGASIGIAYSTDPQTDPQQLLQNADIALYNAKNLGRNRHEFYNQSSRTLLVDAHRLSDDLCRALEQDEIVPYYQLQFDAKSRRVVGAECLARWRHPRLGLIGPDRFLPTAEDCGLLDQIDHIILRKGLADLERWRKKGALVPRISVNVSSRRLHDVGLAASLSTLDIHPGTVSFELLESVFLDRQDGIVMKNLETLRDLSIDIEIDDFGTGHASIVGLLNLKPSMLKIDRQLVEHLPDSQQQRILVMSIIRIARSLKIGVTAEGVETEAHAQLLRRLGCNVLQGFGLARPMSFEEATRFLESRDLPVARAAPAS